MNSETVEGLATCGKYPPWRELFKTKSEMDPSPMKFLISGFLPEGITCIGGLSDSGKTWFCLSMAKAICTGEKFLGNFAVDEPSTVLYLVPESGERSVRHRLDIIGIPDGERFLCRTMSDEPITLEDPRLLMAVRHLQPVVFLDTLVRFGEGIDENDAREAARMARTAYTLYRAGAKSIVCVHHSPKGSGGQQATLENCLRGSGDFGAMADAVYCLKVEDVDSVRIRVQNVKARDFEPVPPFRIQGRPFIDDRGDFGLIGNLEEPKFSKMEREHEEQFLAAIQGNLMATFSQLEGQLKLSRGRIQRIAKKLGWKKGSSGPWTLAQAVPGRGSLAA